MDETVYKALKKIREANKITVLTGAGMSTDSGIPDFRSKTGIYAGHPEKVLSRNFFFEQPKMVYDFIFENLFFPQAVPNPGHSFLAKWEKEGKIQHIITQNMDGLHRKAGNEKVIEFHGTVQTATCFNPKCRKTYKLHELLEKSKTDPAFYRCDCGKSGTKRYIKPDVILFGDKGKWLEGKGWKRVKEEVQAADLLLILGTGLEVFPFAGLPGYRKRDTSMVIISKGKTKYDQEELAIKIEERIGDTLEIIDAYL